MIEGLYDAVNDLNNKKIRKKTAKQWTLELGYSIIGTIDVINNGKVD